MLHSNDPETETPGSRLGSGSGPSGVAGMWWDCADIFHSAAIAFVMDMERCASQLESRSFASEELRRLSHQIRGAAGLFIAHATAEAAAAMEDAIGRPHGATPLNPLVGRLVVALRHDSARMRAVLRMAHA